MENHHFIAGKINYFDWAIFNSYVKLPEGRDWINIGSDRRFDDCESYGGERLPVLELKNLCRPYCRPIMDCDNVQDIG